MINPEKKQRALRASRARRTRARITITNERPRLSVFRSHMHISGQIIDLTGKVLVAASDVHLKDASKLKGVAKATAVGKLLAEKAIAKKIRTVVFDKGSYEFHGRVKAFADGAREGGLQF